LISRVLRSREFKPSRSYSLSVGLVFWSIGMALALGYFTFVYRMFRGKVTQAGGKGYAE
jgi:cytochrome bd ubiquinol oxidase subunit II